MYKNVITIDYEDWFTTSHYQSVVNDTNKKYLLEKPTLKLLDLLEKYQVKATFFVLGQIARDCPKLIKKIHENGHEIASHGYSHTPIHELSRENFIHELRETNKILEDITQEKIKGFRAPFFSIDHTSSWVIDILKEENFIYDSSIFPMKTPRYGIQNAPSLPYYIGSDEISLPSENKQLIEFPISIYKRNGIKIPCSGGIYGRFLPARFMNYFFTQIQQQGYVNLYFHPWELFNKKDLTPYPGMLKNFLANYNSNHYINKLEFILQHFQFINIQTWIDDYSDYIQIKQS